MTCAETMKALESMGSEQTRKTWARHGMGENAFGVSFANLGKLTKQIKTDHALACELWKTGNADARNLATYVADPAKFTAPELDAWVNSITWYAHAGLLSAPAARSPLARARAAAWMKSKQEFVSYCGWSVLGQLAKNPAVPDDLFEERLGVIERDIHKAPNRVRQGMNSALISIGTRSSHFEKRALAAAARIGKVVVDHGDTECKTPDAATYIRKTNARNAARAER